MKSLLIAYIVVCLATPTLAKDATALLAGESAPYNGILLKEARLIELLESEIDASDLFGRLEIQKRYSSNIENIYVRQLDKMSEYKWYETSEFNRLLGFGVGVLLTGFAVFCASHLK